MLDALTRTLPKLERFAPWIAGALVALPILILRYPPMGDLPLHEAIVGLLRHWGDPSFVPANVYELNFGLANQLFYFLILALAYVVPVGTATKLVVAATVFLVPVAAGRLADHLRVSRMSALVVAPLGLGWMFMLGLLANLIGLDVYLLALPSLDRFCQRPTNRGLARACGWIVLLHFAHDNTAVVAAGTLCLFVLTSWKGWEANVIRLFPAFVAAVLTASSYVLAERFVTANAVGSHETIWTPLKERLEGAPAALYSDTFEASWPRFAIVGVCAAPALLFAWQRWTTSARTRRPLRAWAFDFRFEALGLSLVVLYLVAPERVASSLFIGYTFVYTRFLTPAFVLLTLCACPRAPHERLWRTTTVLAAIAPLVSLVLVLPRFFDSDRLYRGLDAAIEAMKPGSAYVVLHVGPKTEHQFECEGAEGHVVAALGGRSFFDYTLSEVSPVFQRVDRQWGSAFQRMGWASAGFLPSHDMKHYRYVLLHAIEPDYLDLGLRALEPEGQLLFRGDDWAVVESKLPLVAMDAPDDPTPRPLPMTLQERFHVLSGGALGRRPGDAPWTPRAR